MTTQTLELPQGLPAPILLPTSVRIAIIAKVQSLKDALASDAENSSIPATLAPPKLDGKAAAAQTVKAEQP